MRIDAKLTRGELVMLDFKCEFDSQCPVYLVKHYSQCFYEGMFG